MLSIFFGTGGWRGGLTGASGGWAQGASRGARPGAPILGLWAVAVVAAILCVSAAAPAAEIEHKVVRGQTLGRIAKRYRVSVDAIREVNGLKPGQLLRPGVVLVIPERGKEAEAAKRAAALRKGEGRKKGARDDKDEPERTGADKGKRGDRKAGADRRGAAKGYEQKPKRPGFVRMVRGGEQLELQLLTRDGRLVPKALPKLSRLLRSPAGSIPIDPRLATLIGMVSNHFGGRTIRVVSGYRPYSPTQYTPHSNHNVGRAMDFVVEGVPNTVLRDFCRTFKNAGVGYYPNSTFVHLDVRSTKVYWVDYSRPGEAPRYDGEGGRVAADEAARDVAAPTEASPGDVYGGSNDTHPAAGQPVENSGANPDIRGAEKPVGDKGGVNRPTPPSAPAAPVPATHGTPAQERK